MVSKNSQNYFFYLIVYLSVNALINLHMDKYKYFEHTVDVIFESYGFKIETAIENAAQAMFDVMADNHQLTDEESVEIEEVGETLEDLVVNVLNDLLAEADSRELFFKYFKVTSFKQSPSGYELKGVAHGCEMKPELGGTVVKAVTYHEGKVEKKGHIWTIHILLDI